MSPEEAVRWSKLTVLQRDRGWSDEELLAALDDSISLRRLVGLGLEEAVPELTVYRRLSERVAELGAPVLATPEDDEARIRRGRPLVSVVSPLYRSAPSVSELVSRICAAFADVAAELEIILVDDGSPDTTWAEIERMAVNCPVRGLRLSRNFGQHIAITAGLEHASGDWVAVIDGDLQEDPGDLPRLLATAQEGYDVVYGVKTTRAHAWWRNLGASLFAGSLRLLAPASRQPAGAGTLSVLSRRVVDAYCRVGDTHRHYLGVLSWLGYPSAEVRVGHRPRSAGKSTYSLDRLARHAVVGIVAQSSRPLYLAMGVGALFLVASLIAALLVVTESLAHGFKAGWASTIVLILLSTSIVLLAVGAVGVYVGKVFEQVRPRPLYLVQQETPRRRAPATRGSA